MGFAVATSALLCKHTTLFDCTENVVRSLNHSMDFFSFVAEFIEIVQVLPPFEEEVFADQAEPRCELQVYCQLKLN